MKRLMIIFAVMATMLASCSKSEPESGASTNGVIQLNLSVSNPCSDSKALIKTGWTTDDRIEIWYDGNTQSTPDLVIRYNGSKWIEDGDAATSGNDPSEGDGKYVKAVYNGSLVVASKDGYTFKDNTLSTRIEHWTFLTEIQVVVTGLTPADYAKYTLSCSNFTPFTGYSVGAESITATAGEANTPVPGISNTEGVAFVFASCTKYDTSAEYKFSLIDGASSGASASTPTTPECVEIKAKYDGATETTLKWAKWNVGASKPEEHGYYFFWGGTQGYIRGTAKGYTLTKTLAQNVSQIKGIKIASSKFSKKNCWVKAENGVELVDGFCWKNAPFNNGSSSYDETYFSSVRSTVCPSDVLAKDYDAACKYLGGSWRMPTSAEIKALYDATKWTWNSTDKGYYVTEKGVSLATDKSNALLFFPAAGSGSYTSLLTAGSFGNYWSSSLYSSTPDTAYRLHFYGVDVNPQSYDIRYYGFTVRPVSD